MLQKNEFSLFKNIFPDYDVFKKWYTSIPLSDGETDCPELKTFTLISYEFNDCHVKYTNESFKQRFANVLYTCYKEFETTTEEIKKLMELSDSEIAISDSMITNIAEIPELESTTDVESVDFISQQQKMINKKGQLQIRREQLANKRIFTVKTFLNRFKKLFRNVVSTGFQQVYYEPDME